jgi:hypothetical protein
MPSEEFIRETQQFWSRKLGRPVSRDEAEEIISNTVNLFDLLATWGRAAERMDETERKEDEPPDGGPGG